MSRNEYIYQLLKTALTINGFEFLETYNVNQKEYPYIYLEIGDERFNYDDFENSSIVYMKNGEIDFEVYCGIQAKTDKNINAVIRPDVFNKIDILENKIKQIDLPKQFTYNDGTNDIYILNLTDIKVIGNYKAYNEARTELMINGIIKFTITYL